MSGNNGSNNGSNNNGSSNNGSNHPPTPASPFASYREPRPEWDTSALLASSPSATAYRELERLGHDMRRGDFAESLEILAAWHEQIPERWALTALAEIVAGDLGLAVVSAYERGARSFLLRAGLQSSRAAHLCLRAHEPELHIWPLGGEHADINQVERVELACGRVINNSGGGYLHRVARGSWQDSTVHCADCAPEAAHYSDCQETSDWPAFAGAGGDRFVARLLATTERLLVDRLYLRPDTEAAIAIALECYPEALLAHAVELALAEPEQTTRRILAGPGGRPLQQVEEDLGKDFSHLLDASAWEALYLFEVPRAPDKPSGESTSNTMQPLAEALLHELYSRAQR